MGACPTWAPKSRLSTMIAVRPPSSLLLAGNGMFALASVASCLCLWTETSSESRRLSTAGTGRSLVSVQIVEDHSPDTQLDVAQVWAAATARRGGQAGHPAHATPSPVLHE